MDRCWLLILSDADLRGDPEVQYGILVRKEAHRRRQVLILLRANPMGDGPPAILLRLGISAQRNAALFTLLAVMSTPVLVLETVRRRRCSDDDREYTALVECRMSDSGRLGSSVVNSICLPLWSPTCLLRELLANAM